MIALHRQNLRFNPELSIVAEVEGKVAGHVLFYPHDFYLAGELVKGVVLSPLGVNPTLQNQGIGSLLIVEGQRRAAKKGYVFSLLLGHPPYYPRFGYHTHMFGSCFIKIDHVNVPNVILEERKVLSQDILFLQEMWQLWFGDNSLTFGPEDSILDWISSNPEIRSVIVMSGDEAIGYLRYKVTEPLQPRYFLAVSQAATCDLLGHIHALGIRAGGDSNLIQLPVHPEGRRTKEWIPLSYSAEIAPWDAAMIGVLDERCDPIREYVDRARQRISSIGTILWPVEFDVL